MAQVTVTLRASKRWWFYPVLTAHMLACATRVISDQRLDRWERWIARHGIKTEVS
jgi:hypothetical protein